MADTVQELVNEVRAVQQELESAGELQTALALCKVLAGYYTTSTEAVGEILQVMSATAGVWEGTLAPQTSRRARAIVSDARRFLAL
jgi:hypothetical protein